MWQMAFFHRWPGQSAHPRPLCHALGHLSSSKRGIAQIPSIRVRPRTTLTAEGTLCQFWEQSLNGWETCVHCLLKPMPSCKKNWPHGRTLKRRTCE